MLSLTNSCDIIKHLLCECADFDTRVSAVNKIGRNLPLIDLISLG